MGRNIIELAKLGHERAAELKASCGAVDVRSLAQLISDLATQLEVQFVRSTNMAVQLANAESKCRELAAEVQAVRWACGQVYVKGYNHGHLNTVDRLPYADEKDLVMRGGEVLCEFTDPDHCGVAADAILAEVRAQSRNEGINYAASRLAAAFNHGFVDKPLAEVCDVVRMILDTKEELEKSTLPAADGISGEYAEKFLAEFAAQLRKGAAL
ncbi:TPA: hypothetical protein ACHFX4_001134 [Citrobacter freundii]|uniref:hypothetical protein n=1 Tax=Citrobacter freundii TaxID=546 RepID=UPI0037406C51|nr:hypothetical protein [Citrobacter freundii]